MAAVSCRATLLFLIAGVEPRNDGAVSHKPLRITVAAVMASRQLSEGRYHQAVGGWVKRETGQTQSVCPAAQTRHRMQMPTDVQKARNRCTFGDMAQPQGPQLSRWMLRKPFNPAVPVMVATDQHHLAIAELMEMKQGLAQRWGHAFSGMNQITQEQQLLRSPRMAEIQQRIQRAAITITRQWDAMGLKGFGLSEVEIRHHQLPTHRSPHRALGKEAQGFLTPAPVDPIHQVRGVGLVCPGCIATAHSGSTRASFHRRILARVQLANQMAIKTL